MRLLGRDPVLGREDVGVPVGGMVFGMSNTVVTPPKAAAAVPAPESSLCG